MKQLILGLALILTGCGAIGIGSNHDVTIRNNSNDMIFATGDMGRVKIRPDASLTIRSRDTIQLLSENPSCDILTVQRRLNSPAFFLDVFPGFILGIAPITVDALSGNLYRMPDEFIYDCNE